MKTRILGLDIGDRTIGLAVSDALGITAQGVQTIRRTKLTEDLEKLDKVVEEYKIDLFVLGLPKNMDNSIGFRAEASIAYGKLLEKELGLPVDYVDERLTTVQAEKMLINEGNVSRKKRKKVIDKLAAVILLQNYLDSQ